MSGLQTRIVTRASQSVQSHGPPGERLAGIGPSVASSKIAGMVEIACPACGRQHVRLSRPRGAVDRLLHLAAIHPLRCDRCRHRFYRWTPWYPGAVQEERRQHERIAARVLIGIQWGEEGRDGTMTDVSLGGAGVEGDVPVPEGTLLKVTFRPTERGTTVGISQAIVRSTRPGKLGLEFAPLDEDERRRIADLVREILRTRQQR